jgi:ABC-type transport system substrate-binding protein
MTIKSEQRPALARWLTLGVAIALGLTACTPGAGTGGAQEGGTITIGLAADPNGLDPLRMSAGSDDLVSHLIYDPLFQRMEFGQVPEPVVAESLEPNDDLTSWTLKVRDGITFSDGTPLDAEAVKVNIDRHIDPDNASGFAGPMGPIESTTVVDDLTLTIDLESPWANLIYALAIPIAEPTAWVERGEDFNRDPVGSGAYELVEWVTGDHLTFQKRDDYWGTAAGINPAYVDTYEIKIIPDAASRQQALSTGEIDMNVSPRAEDVLAAQNSGGELVASLVPPGATGGLLVTFNLNIPALDDIRLREAIAYSTDREALIELYDGLVEVDPGPFHGSLWDSGLEYPGFDLDRAKAAAEDYFAENPGPVSFTLTFTTEQERQAQALQAMWKEVGIDVVLNGADVNTVITNIFNKDFEMLLFGVGTISPHPDFQLPTFIGSNAVLSGTAKGDTDVDAALEAARTTIDLEEQREAYEVIDRKWAEEYIWVWTVTGFAAVEARSCIKGSALDGNRLTNTSMPNLGGEIWTECGE